MQNKHRSGIPVNFVVEKVRQIVGQGGRRMAVLWETRSLMYRIHCHTWNSPEIVNSAQPFYA